jgi:hypothetical protein
MEEKISCANKFRVLTMKTTKKGCYFLHFLAIFFAVLLFGCSLETLNTPLPALPVKTTQTPKPTTKPSSTATPSLQPTWTPVATLPLEIRRQNLIKLFSTNGDCEFPCWWGIHPGDPIQKVSELAPVIGKSLYADGSFYYYTLALDNLNLLDFDANFFVDANQTVQRIEISLREPIRFRDYHAAFEVRLSLAGLLGRYGKPSEVLFLITPRFEPGETPRPYTLFLIYDNLDFGIVYSGLVDSEDPLQVCSIKLDDYHLQYILLYLQDPRPKIAVLNRFNSTEFQPLEQVTSMSLDDFYRIFSEPESNKCIEVSVDVWQ